MGGELSSKYASYDIFVIAICFGVMEKKSRLIIVHIQ